MTHSKSKRLNANQPNPGENRTNRQFTIRSILVVTVIMAVGSAGAGQLFRAANGSMEDIGPFVLITSMAPLGVMIAVNLLFRLFGKL